jgi:septum formation protein
LRDVGAPLDLYLASTSPRRRELLARAGLRFECCEPGDEYAPGEGDEHGSTAGDPVAHAAARATRKGEGAAVPDPRVPVLAVDTVVDVDGQELGKPRDRADAEAMLRALAGRTHRVHTAHYLRDAATGRSALRIASADVACEPTDEGSLRAYLDSGQWRGKAGSYGVQDDAQRFFRVVRGAFDTVVGLHVPAVRELLRELAGVSR